MESGTKLGHYEILSLLGKGGMGEVWRAKDTKLGREVAIKTLPEEFAKDTNRLARIEREAKLLASLNHPHICTLHDFGDQDGTHFLVMEHVEGETLKQRLGKGRIPLDQIVEYAIQITDALDKAHRQGIVHRDLKPGNIMLTKSDVKVLDFGLAKTPESGDETLTASLDLMGTPAYMAPEQFRG